MQKEKFTNKYSCKSIFDHCWNKTVKLLVNAIMPPLVLLSLWETFNFDELNGGCSCLVSLFEFEHLSLQNWINLFVVKHAENIIETLILLCSLWQICKSKGYFKRLWIMKQKQLLLFEIVNFLYAKRIFDLYIFWVRNVQLSLFRNRRKKSL